MHPILADRKRLGLYLAAWIPMGALLGFMLMLTVHSPWIEAVAVTAPLIVLYAFLCLAAWYPCRALPLHQTGMARALGSHLATAVASSLVWVAMAVGLAELLSGAAVFAGTGERIRGAAVLLLAFGILLYLLSVAVHYLAVTFEASREAQARALRAELGAREAELHALRTQLDPHFIFNSLNSISSLVTSDARAAREMCVQLGEFLRDSLRLGRRTVITMHEELALIRRYLAVEQVRYGPRLEVEEVIDTGTGTCRIPPLLLQPLVENALKHGISELVDGGTLGLEVRHEGRRLRLVVENPVDPDAGPRQTRGAGVGLDNVRRRLRSVYGSRARLKVMDGEKARFRVEVILPVDAEESGDDS